MTTRRTARWLSLGAGTLVCLCLVGCVSPAVRLPVKGQSTVSLVAGGESTRTAVASSSDAASAAATATVPKAAETAEKSKQTTRKLPARERRAILSALRAPIQRELDQPVRFVVNWIKVDAGPDGTRYAIVLVVPVRPDGGDIDYGLIVQFKEQVAAGAMDDTTEAVLQKKGGRWRVLEYRIGPTDTKTGVWLKRYHLQRRDPIYETD